MSLYDTQSHDFFGCHDLQYTDICIKEKRKFNNKIARIADLLANNLNKTIHISVNISRPLPEYKIIETIQKYNSGDEFVVAYNAYQIFKSRYSHARICYDADDVRKEDLIAYFDKLEMKL